MKPAGAKMAPIERRLAKRGPRRDKGAPTKGLPRLVGWLERSLTGIINSMFTLLAARQAALQGALTLAANFSKRMMIELN